MYVLLIYVHRTVTMNLLSNENKGRDHHERLHSAEG